MYRLFAVTAPGLESFTRQELGALGLDIGLINLQTASGEPSEESGGVEFEADLSELYRANLHLRTSNRILTRLGDFYAAAFSELRKKASRLPWEQYIRPGKPISVRVTCHKSKLYHSDGVAERISGAISDRLGRPSPLQKFADNADPLPQLIIVRLVYDRCTISIDTSGALLHRRGYRLETAKAPLRETLAAGLLYASGWDPAVALLDPFCGSGTISIESAMISRKISPGKNRRFAFMDWPNFDARLWQSLLNLAISQEISTSIPILASDRDAGAIQIAQSNAVRAGVAQDIQFSCRAFSAIEPPAASGWIVTNPPYGIRVSPTHDLRNLYTRLGDVMRLLCPNWNIAFLCADPVLAGHTRLPFDSTLQMVNGGVPVKLFISKAKTPVTINRSLHD